MIERRSKIDLSVVVPVGGRHADALELYREYKAGLDAQSLSYEFIFVLDGPRPQFAAALDTLMRDGSELTVVSLTRTFGESTALMAGFERASGETILTLPAYHQIEGGEIGKLLQGLDKADFVIGHRWPRAGGALEAFRRRVFHGVIASVTKLQFRDLGCGARVMHRQVLEEISLYGDQHRFLPILADRQGFRVAEVDVRQSPKDRLDRIYRPREYTRQALDIFNVFFLVRFTKKPLRFFGMVGVSTFAIGAALVTYLVIDRLFWGRPLADRPALLLSSLLVVLGLQLFALGLLGELIIFTHAKNLKDYKVDKVIEFPADSPGQSSVAKPEARSA